MNCYIVQRDNSCFIIDPGYQKERIHNYIQTKGYNVKGILLTHGHIDHIEALDCFDVPVYIHKLEYPILVDNYQNGFAFFEKEPSYTFDSLDIELIDEGTLIPLGDEHFEVIHTPGHTLGSVCFKIGHEIYTGDTLFIGSVGKWDRSTGDINELKDSVLRLMDGHHDFMLIHPGHGKSSIIGLKKQFNHFYREWSSTTLALPNSE
ncbi:MBL fold metallo-hydrolase [Prolixibacteraceae bacterium]|nr:MBL fold metallo-hydrolase [Prolixibacteraceae bacterium]